jgi:hypothetical protein
MESHKILIGTLFIALLVAPAVACGITNDASRSCLQTDHWIIHFYNDTSKDYIMVMVVENLNSSTEDRFFPWPEPGDVPIENATITFRPHAVGSGDWTIVRTCYTDSRGICIVDAPEEFNGKKFDIVIDYYDAAMVPYCDNLPSGWSCGLNRYTDTYFPEPGLPWYVWLVYRKWKKEDEQRAVSVKEE